MFPLTLRSLSLSISLFLSLSLFLRARQSVRDARLHLDSWKQTLKVTEATGKTDKLEAQRNEVEGAEDKLVSATEEAIALMKSVLENPEPFRSLNAFVKAQAQYHKTAAELLEELSSEISRQALDVESDYRSSRG